MKQTFITKILKYFFTSILISFASFILFFKILAIVNAQPSKNLLSQSKTINNKTLSTGKYTNFLYAQVENDGTYLYKTNLSTFLQNAYFEIPKTYFVMILSNIDDTFYKVQYGNFSGFVLKSQVTVIDETPKTPTLEGVTFRVYATDGLNILTSPFDLDSQKIVYHLPNLPTLNYIGKIEGDELVENRGTTWYFCTYLDAENITYTGYVYAGFCDNLSTIPKNTESVTKAQNYSFDNDNEYLYNLITLSPFLKVVIIILLTIPSVAILILLTSPPKRLKAKPQTTKNLKKQNKSKNINKIQTPFEDNTI